MGLRLALATGFAMLLAACGSGSTPRATDLAAPSSPSAATRVVPWADLPPAHQPMPTTDVPAMPDPAAAEAAPPCTAGQIAVTDQGADGAAGTMFERLTLSLRRGDPCSLEGWPSVSYRDGSKGSGIAVTRDDNGYAVGGFAYRHPVLVGDGSTASIELAWSDAICDYHRSVRSTAVTLTLAAGGSVTALLATPDEPSCYLDAEHRAHGNVQPVTLGRFYPTDYRPAVTTSTWDAVATANGRALHLRGAADSTLRFTVTLLARGRDVPLQPCPDYQIAYGLPDPSIETHQLNCNAVPYMHDGVPYLPAGTPVSFAMHATAPAHNAPKMTWRIPVHDDAGGPGWFGDFTLREPASTGKQHRQH